MNNCRTVRFIAAPVVLLFVLAVFCSTTNRPAFAAEPSAPRVPATSSRHVIAFPATPLGTLYVAPRPSGRALYIRDSMRFKKLGTACGEVEIPAGSIVKLKFALKSIQNFSYLKKLTNTDIQAIDVSACNFSDRNLSDIAHLDGLLELRLAQAPLSPTAIAKLQKFPHLRVLQLARCGVSDDAMPAIGALKELELLALTGNDISDKGVAALAGMKHLRVLELQGTSVSDGAADTIRSLPLIDLDVAVTKVGDKFVQAIADMPQLLALNLVHCQITDAAVPSIIAHKSLRSLTIRDDKLSKSALAKLHAGLPQCDIQSGESYRASDYF